VAEMMFYKENNFKETSIGKVPKEWKVVKLSDKAEVVSGFGFPLDYQGKRSGKYPFIKVNDLNLTQKYAITADNFIDDEDLKALKAEVFQPNTIIFPKIGMAIYLNKFRILKTWGTFDNNIAGVIPKEINPEFLFYYFLGKTDLKQLSGRTTAPSIRKTTLESILIPYPSLSEQQKIAEVLSTVDETIQKTDEVIAKTERLKKGLMQELLTRGIGHKEFKDTEIGRIPKGWEVVRLRDIAERVTDITSEKELARDQKKYVLYSIPAYHEKGKPELIYAEKIGSTKFHVHMGDILFGKINPKVPKVWMVEYADALASTEFIVLRPNENRAISKYLYYLLQTDRILDLSISSAKGAVPSRLRTDAESFMRIPIQLPQLSEQQKIAEIISTVDKKLEIERNEKAKLERIKQGLMDLLLTGKIRVKVN
jgi:type I restriction enzyme S subunit